MITENLGHSIARPQACVHLLRDACRLMRGRPPKHTLRYQTPRDFQSHSVSDAEFGLLAKMVRESARVDGPIVEVGVLAGRTTQRIASVKSAAQKILAVDNFCWNDWALSPQEQFSLVKLSLAYLIESGDVEVHRIDKNEFYERYDGPPPALVFLDAMHVYEETKKDIVWAMQVGAKIICGHDYGEQFPGVTQAVDEFGGPRLLAETLFVL